MAILGGDLHQGELTSGYSFQLVLGFQEGGDIGRRFGASCVDANGLHQFGDWYESPAAAVIQPAFEEGPRCDLAIARSAVEGEYLLHDDKRCVPADKPRLKPELLPQPHLAPK